MSNRRERMKENGGEYSLEDWVAMRDIVFDGRCVKCGRKDGRLLHADHIVPVSRGGTGFISNIQPLCRNCNLEKQDREITDYRLTYFSRFGWQVPPGAKERFTRFKVRKLIVFCCLNNEYGQGDPDKFVEWKSILSALSIPSRLKQIALAEFAEWTER